MAHPDGHMTLEESVVPRRVERADGSWVPVQLALARQADGSWKPLESVVDVRFSRGGNDPLVTLVRDGKSLVIEWPDDLPPPEVLDNTAKYPEVLPGVDLIVRATETGFAHVLVVKTPQAAATSRVRQIRFRLGGDADVVAYPDGQLEAFSGTTRIADATPAVMWDSSTATATSSTATATKSTATATSRVQKLGVAAASIAGSDTDPSTSEAPGDAAKVAAVTTRIDGDDLVLHPDSGLLTAPASAFPLYVDPLWSAFKKSWAYATSNNTNNDSISVARVGKDPEGSRTYRSFFQFSTVGLKGKHVESAKVVMELDHSASCGETWTHLYTAAAITDTPRTKWSTKLYNWMAAQKSRAPEGDGCPNKNDQPVIFSNSILTKKVDQAADERWNTITFAFCACNEDHKYEDDEGRWKKFFPKKALLRVDYASAPGKPDKLKIAGIGCIKGQITSIGTLSPTFSATYHDDDFDVEQAIMATYEWIKWPAQPKQAEAAPRLPAPGKKSVIGSGPPGKMVGTQTSAAVTVQKGPVYAFRTFASDPKPYSIDGKPSDWCMFTVDTTVPGIPDVEVLQAPTVAGGSGRFRFTSTNSDVVKFRYGWDPSPLNEVAATGTTVKTAELAVTVGHYGSPTLYVYAIDATQNKGNPWTEIFKVERPADAITRWGLESDPVVTTEADAMADLRPAVGGDTPLTWDSAGSDHRFRLDARLRGGSTASFDAVPGGVGGSASAAVPALDTSKSFSVAAWARLAEDTSSRTLLSKDGSQMSAFRLQYRAATKQWCFTLRAKDDKTAAEASACGDAPIKGRWTHVAGVYDDAESRLTLFVDGAPTVVRPTAAWLALWAGGWNAPGKVIVGRAQDANLGGPAEYFNGDIADVQLFDRPLIQDDITGRLGSEIDETGVDELGIMVPVEVGDWDFQDARKCAAVSSPAFCRAPDATAWGRQLTLTPGVGIGTTTRGRFLQVDRELESAVPPAALSRDFAWSQQVPINGAVLQDTAVLRTDQSFSVATWVRIDSGITGRQTVLTQDTVGAGLSGFDLSYLDAEGWSFTVRNGASSASDAQRTVATAEATSPNDWHHLVAVYDLAAQQIRLYVDGAIATSTVLNSGLVPWSATGPLAIGRSDQAGGFGDWLSGSVDDVRVYQGAVGDVFVHHLYESQSAEADLPES
jgi:hypothetical protein